MIDGLKSSSSSHITQINDKKVILDINSGKYFMLNNIAAQIWDFIQSSKNISLEEVSHQLAENYNQKEEIILKEIKDFIETTSKFGLLSK